MNKTSVVALQRTAAGIALVMLTLGLTGACAHHLRFVTPDTTGSSRFDCAESTQCVPARHDVPEDANQSGTMFITLPRECGGRVHEILVLDADSSSPQVTVTCAPIENSPTEVMN